MIAIVNYKAGNLRSVLRACQAVGVDATITDDPSEVASAERIIFPGVGQAASAMRNLNASGMAQALRSAHAAGTPFLGICLGTQIILSHSEEGDTPCLGLESGANALFKFDDPSYKVPHIGWNAVRVVQPHPLLEGLQHDDEFYFVHSYYPTNLDPSHVYGVTDYGGEFCAAFGSGNLFATQFHLEKSGRLGLAMLKRFASWDGTVPTASISDGGEPC